MTPAQVPANAVRTAIRAKVTLSDIDLRHWSISYNVSQREVREAFTHELTDETNSNMVGEGK